VFGVGKKNQVDNLDLQYSRLYNIGEAGSASTRTLGLRLMSDIRLSASVMSWPVSLSGLADSAANSSQILWTMWKCECIAECGTDVAIPLQLWHPLLPNTADAATMMAAFASNSFPIVA
jgi:hypothetical protein